MAFDPFSRAVILSIGLGWGLLSGLIFSSSSYFKEWELTAHRTIVQRRKPAQIPKDILLVRLRLQPQRDPEQFLYADEDLLTAQFNSIIARLIPTLIDQHNARLVILRAPPQWPASSDNPSEAAVALERYHPRLVLVNAVAAQNPTQPPEINNYNSVLPFDNQTLQPKLLPQAFQSFWEEPSPETGHTVQLAGRFTMMPSGKNQIFPSVALLASQKLHESSPPTVKEPQRFTLPKWTFTPVWIPFLGPSGTFPQRDLQLDCPSQRCYQGAIQSLGNIKDKILFIDASDTRTQTPLGPMPTQEVQANILVNLRRNTFVQEVMPLKPTLTLSSIAVVACLIAIAIIWSVETQSRWLQILGVGGPLLGVGCLLIYVLVVWQGFLLPLLFPLSTWMGTMIATALAALIWKREIQFNQKVRELDLLRGETEEEALVLKTQTLLRRIACDVHGGPLQELRVAIFQIESLKRSHPQLEVTPILEGLVQIGQDVRQQLNNVQDMAAKLRMTPLLRDGLAAGMRLYLEQLVASGRLQLRVIQDLQTLNEPDLNTLWIAAREDIFRFFCEALNNVMYHAQPPRGDATEVVIYLQQIGEQSSLAIANNGSPVHIKHPGGQGTKAMTEIARDLPNGQWSRKPLPEGGLCVELRWSMAMKSEDD